jgi:hypothetical protein
MHGRTYAIAAVLGFVGFAAPAAADDTADLKAKLEAMSRRMEAQDRRMKELEGTRLSQDEVSAAVASYLETQPQAFLVGGGGGADGSAGFPMQKKPFIKEGPNKLEIGYRNQVRYESFRYSDDAVGVLNTPPSTISDAAPRNRSGFEIERMYLVLEGSVFCEEFTFKTELNFDSDSGTGLEKNYMYLDWKYSGEHHIRAGSDKSAYCYEENNSSGSLAFVDRSIATKAFEIGFTTGVALWGYLGSCDCPKQFMYKVQVSNGEGRVNQEGSIFNTSSFDAFSDQVLIAGMFEWTITCKDWKWDEVDSRPCDKRCGLDAAIGIAGYYENDDDQNHLAWGGLALRNPTDRADRFGLNAWFRAQWNGLSGLAEFLYRDIDYTQEVAGTGFASTAHETQTDYGAHVMLHYRFADTNWGVGVRGSIIWLDDDYDTITVGATSVDIEDTIKEFGFVVNYFLWDHNNKISADVNWVQDNSGVNSSSAGYMFGVTNRGVVVEDGIMFRVQWQISL